MSSFKCQSCPETNPSMFYESTPTKCKACKKRTEGKGDRRPGIEKELPCDKCHVLLPVENFRISNKTKLYMDTCKACKTKMRGKKSSPSSEDEEKPSTPPRQPVISSHNIVTPVFGGLYYTVLERRLMTDGNGNYVPASAEDRDKYNFYYEQIKNFKYSKREIDIIISVYSTLSSHAPDK